ncbi:MAG: hypothetical protein N3B13_10320, partial [Deltaproteobacteria bacterium]|nr:hypothetical protein [Deltaproteobacteria bacterium]
YKNCIVVIRPDTGNPEEFNKLFEEIFSDKSAESYLKGLSSEAREAIYKKSFAAGLSESEIVIIFGKPDQITYFKEGDNNLKIMDYQSFRVIIKDGRSYKYETLGSKQ